jgi:hypothetical protein
MGNKLLVRYIKMALDEAALSARVPQQLMPNSESGDKDKDNEEENVQEFSGAGAVAGFTAPLGMSADSLGRKKNKSSRKKK